MSELIDREATVKQICKIGEMVGGHDRDVVISIALFVQDDKTAFPTVERPHGEWNGKAEERVVTSRFCTSCGIRGAVGNFCMWCGADMRKKEGGSN